jgi:hypothetical protein
MRELDQAHVERYVQAEQPLDCAGSFKAEGLGVSLFQSTHGCDATSLIGLPLIRLVDMLHQGRRAGTLRTHRGASPLHEFGVGAGLPRDKCRADFRSTQRRPLEAHDWPTTRPLAKRSNGDSCTVKSTNSFSPTISRAT